MDEELMIAIPLGRFEELLDTETRAAVLQDATISASYSVDREDIARILRFKLPKEQKGEGPF